MKLLLLAFALIASAPAFAGDVGVSITVGHPGFYGQIEIGGFPPPPLIFPRPVIIERVPAPGPPIYLHVPPGHAKKWAKHCHKYNACGHPAYFVEELWYRDVYVPRYQARQGEHPGDKGSGKKQKRHGGKGKK